MSEHRATIKWERDSEDFAYDTYTRDHSWEFDAGLSLAASAAPDYKGNTSRVDPEEAFVASLSSCHMLTFLAIAARKRLVVDRYQDVAIGFMEKNSQGKLAIMRVELRPQITFGGQQPSPEELRRLHEKAHEHCFIANSVKTDVQVIEG